jgi:hypothetical protein
MSNDFSTLCDQAEQSGSRVLRNLGQISATLRGLQAEIDKLPFFVRGFATSEISKGTGQDIPAWLTTTSSLQQALQEAQAAVARSRDAGAVSESDRSVIGNAAERSEAVRSRLESLVGFMETIPSKLKLAPPGLLPADRRDEFLATIDGQKQALRDTIAAIPELTQSLRALTSSAA